MKRNALRSSLSFPLLTLSSPTVDRIFRGLRQVTRGARLASSFVFAAVDHYLRRCNGWGPRECSQWVSRWSTSMLNGMDFKIRYIGEPPCKGFIVPNHLGYIDILVLASITPLTFLSRADVAGWPLIGAYTKMGGTLYIDRSKRSDVSRKDEEFAKVIESGVGITVFLEGTSSDGSEILPFRSSLLAPVVKNKWPITPAYIQYDCDGADPTQEVCWWGDMEFGSHLLNMLKIPRIRATVAFGHTRVPGDCRKALAEELRQEVLELRRLVKAYPKNKTDRSLERPVL